MRCRLLPVLALLLVRAVCAEEPVDQIMNRVSEEAEVFWQMASSVVGREVLRQRARKKPSRFKLRVGSDAAQAPKPRFQEREIVSEYSFGSVAEAPNALLELREVVSVDGRSVAGHHKARESLTMGIRSNNDKAKKKMLQRFRKHGLEGAATDFGQVILLFRRPNLDNYTYSLGRTAWLGADTVQVVNFRQVVGPEAFTIFHGRKATKAGIEGELWVRQRDNLPLRVILRTSQPVDGGKQIIEHTGIVTYQPSSYGVILPVLVRYNTTIDGEMLMANTASYEDYQMFAVDAQIRFTPEDVPLEGPNEPALAQPPEPQ
jgi:hypothetical protein